VSGLRFMDDPLVTVSGQSVPTSYRYCPLRQVAVDAVTGEPRPPLCKVLAAELTERPMGWCVG
jgi:hypothetical protein